MNMRLRRFILFICRGINGICRRRYPRLAGAAKLDITEIEGFDDLHAPKGILLEAQERAAAVFGADETFFW